ncbi:MAG: hypothetical protein R3190_07810, partial [Thermoanaerobaculia bacterium]|nr:hypothetical protein [Thermoanaerobaculia bacterium]
MRRSLIHYWRMNVAVVLSCAVAVAVLAGALVVGDSVRGSLRDLTLERLGAVDYALVAPTFFRQALADELAAEAGAAVEAVAAAIVMPGGARNPATGARASGLGVQGVDAGFAAVFPGAELALDPGGVVVNEALARELGVAAGEALLLSLERPGEAPRDSLLGSTETGDVVRQLRLEVAAVVPDRGLGRFSLEAHQSLPLVAFVALDELQEALDQPGRANALLVAAPDDGELGRLEAALSAALDLEDLGLIVTEGPGWAALASRDHILSPALESEVAAFAARLASPWLRISTYIANRLAAGDRAVPYSAITAFDTATGPPFGPLPLADGGGAPELGPGEVLVN